MRRDKEAAVRAASHQRTLPRSQQQQAMDDFLLDTPRSTYACNSVEDLKEQLANLRLAKVTESRAEHISATFEFPSSAAFSIPETEDDASAAASAASPVRDGPDAAVPGTAVGSRANYATREIRAHDVLVNQPADDPALQKAVARHVIASLGGMDNSSWAVCSVSRGAAGWSFHYLCRGSTRAWQRQASKDAAKVLVGESSGKDGQDPVNLARPAFDCRGSVTIAFVKNSRLITVKLEHTPFHKTVADLAELYKPPPPPAGIEPRRREGGRKKRKSQAVEGATNEESPKKKRKKKSENPEGTNAEGTNAEGTQTPKPKRPQSARASITAAGGGEAQGHDQQQLTLLNLSPGEMARRRDEATKKLSDNGVDPSTLSTEQFEIFANQSPELQNESLAMLIRYGAERLRIVHPDKDDASSSNANPANGAASDSSGKRKKKKKYNTDGTERVRKTRGSCQSCRTKKKKCSKEKPACSQCLKSGLSCHYPPQQSQAPFKSAAVAHDEPDDPNAEVSAEISAEIVAEASAPAPAPAQVTGSVVEPAAPGAEEASDLGSPGFTSSYAPGPETLPQPADTSSHYQEASHDFFHQPGTSGHSYSQAVPDQMSNGMDYSAYPAEALQQHAGPGSMTYHHQSQQVSQTDHRDLLGTAPPPAPAPAPGPPPEPTQPVQSPIQRAPSTSSPSGVHRRMTPSSVQSQAAFPSSASTTHGSSWPMAAFSAGTAQTFSGSPPRKSTPVQATAAPPSDRLQQDELRTVAILSQAALQKAQPPPATRTVSPFQVPKQAARPAARAKSRQGQRPQKSLTTAPPLQHNPAAQVPPSASTSAMSNSANAAHTNNVPNYDQYSRYTTADNQDGQVTSRRAYDLYPLQQNVSNNNASTSYSGYDAYNSQSPTPTTTGLAAPMTQTMTSSSSGTATGASSANWPKGTARRDSNSYDNNSVATSTNSAYHLPTAPIHHQKQQQQQQQPPLQLSAAMQSSNKRPQSTTRSSRTKASASYKARQQAQQPREQPQSYGHYPSQSHNASSQQQQQQQQQQHDWSAFGSTNDANPGYGSSSRGSASYGHSGSGSVPYGQQRAAGHSGNTYQGLDQHLYEMLRNNQG